MSNTGNSEGYRTLRSAAIAIAVIILVALVIGIAMGNIDLWPVTLGMLILCAALAFERQHYGRAVSTRPGPEWEETSEQFIDDSSGELVRVWYNPATGERRYIGLGDPRPMARAKGDV